MDIVFAISANAADATANFELMKNLIKSLIDEYGQGTLRYQVIVYGDTVSTEVNFTERFPTNERLKSLIEALSPASGVPALDKALDEAWKAFKGRGARSNTTKVTV